MEKEKEEKKGKDKDEKIKADPKVKTEQEKLWSHCSAFGRKLDSMATHSKSIVEQSQEKDNDWSWAVGQVSSLQAALEKATPVIHKWSSNVRTSSLQVLLSKHADIPATVSFLTELKADVEKNIETIESPLGVLVGMHSIMLKKRSPLDAKKVAKKVKLE